MRTVTALLTLLITLTACDPEPACETDSFEADAKLWVASCDWPVYAQGADQAKLDEALEAGVLLEPVDAGIDAVCYPSANADGSHVCTGNYDGLEVLGRPATEVDLTPSDCVAGDWKTYRDPEFGDCWAQLGDLAVLVREG